MRVFPSLAAAAFLCLIRSSDSLAITLAQVDDFEDGTTHGWSEGPVSPNPPVVTAGGGPGGPSDRFLENVSSGAPGAGGKLVIMNITQWTGNYPEANVHAIRVWFRNSGATPLTMRLAFEGASTHYSSQGFSLPADDQWHEALFLLDELILIGGNATPEQTLSAVNAMRILAATDPNWEGDQVAATVGIDEITALPTQVPVVSRSWGFLKARYSGSPRSGP